MEKPRPRAERVGIWVRISVDDPAPRPGAREEGRWFNSNSPIHHEQRAREYAEERGWTVVEVYTSIISGKSVWNLPEAVRMRADVESGRITAVIVSNVERLVRNTKEAIELADFFDAHGAKLIGLDEPISRATPADRYMFTNRAALAQYVREQDALRVRANLRARAKLGSPLSGAASFGYRWKDGKLSVDPVEAPIRRLIYELYRVHQRKGAVARLLNDAGHRSRKGKKFTPLAIERLILDPTAKGTYRANYTTRSEDGKRTILKPESEWIITPVEPIVSEELWEECVAILKSRRQPQNRPAKRPVHLFAGLLYCGKCDLRMYVFTNSSKYACPQCKAKIPCDDLEAIFIHKLREWAFSRDEVARHVAEADDELAARKVLLAQLESERAKLARKMEKTHELYLADQIPLESFGRLYRPLEERFIQLEDEIPRLQAEVDARRIHHQTADGLTAAGANLAEIWPGLAREEQRALVEMLTERITLTGDAIEIALCYIPPGNQEVTNSARSPPSEAGFR